MGGTAHPTCLFTRPSNLSIWTGQPKSATTDGRVTPAHVPAHVPAQLPTQCVHEEMPSIWWCGHTRKQVPATTPLTCSPSEYEHFDRVPALYSSGIGTAR